MADTHLVEVFGMDTFSMGDPGADGAMGTSLTTYSKVKNDTMTFSLPPPTGTSVNIYQSSSPYAIILQGDADKITFEVLGLKLSDLPNFLGGTFESGSGGTKDKWTKPAEAETIIQSVFVGTKDEGGRLVGFNFPKCQISGGFDLSPSKTDGYGVSVVVDVLAPLDASQTPLGSMFIEGETIT